MRGQKKLLLKLVKLEISWLLQGLLQGRDAFKFVFLSRVPPCMPFPVLNACGVLDAKASAEEAMVADASAGGYAYTIVRPGQLFGGPYTNNYYLGTLFQLDKDAKTQDVSVALGVRLASSPARGCEACSSATRPPLCC